MVLGTESLLLNLRGSLLAAVGETQRVRRLYAYQQMGVGRHEGVPLG